MHQIGISKVLTALRFNGKRGLEHSLTTSWTLIQNAAEGEGKGKEFQQIRARLEK